MYQYDSPLIQFTKTSYSGYNSMRQQKKDGFLNMDYYQRFLESGLSVTEAA